MLKKSFSLYHIQQLPSGEQWWRAASQSEEKQEQLKQWHHQEGGDKESLELRGCPARDPATAQNPHQTSSHQVGLLGDSVGVMHTYILNIIRCLQHLGGGDSTCIKLYLI